MLKPKIIIAVVLIAATARSETPQKVTQPASTSEPQRAKQVDKAIERTPEQKPVPSVPSVANVTPVQPANQQETHAEGHKVSAEWATAYATGAYVPPRSHQTVWYLYAV